MKRIHTNVNAGNVPYDPDDDNDQKTIRIRAKKGGKVQTIVLDPDGSLQLLNLQAQFPSATNLLLTTDMMERIRKPENGSFKEPRKGWRHYEVYAVIPDLNFPNVSDLLTRFHVSTFNELWTIPEFAPAGIYNKEKFAKYRGGAIQVFLPLILKLGPGAFHLSTLYRMSICDPAICHALLFLVQKHRRCFTCNVKFKNALKALKHFASIYHGQKCLVNFQEPELIEALLTNARDLGFFSAGDKTPVPLTRDADPSDVDSDTNGTASDDEPPKNRPAALPLPPAISDDDDDSGDRDVYEESANEDEYPDTNGDSDGEDSDDGSVSGEPPAKRPKTMPLSVTADDSGEVSDRDEPSDFDDSADGKYATVLKPKYVFVGCINQRLDYLNRHWTASRMQLVERKLLCRELMRRGLYHPSCEHISC